MKKKINMPKKSKKRLPSVWNFKGDSVIISGGSRGIGAGLVRCFARSGAKILFGDIDAVGAQQLCEELSDEKCEVHFLNADFSTADAWQCMREEARRLKLNPGLVVAGVGIGFQASVENTSLEDYDYYLNANLRSAWLAAREFAPVLKKREGSSLLLIGSVMGYFGTANYSLYGTSKAALSGLLRALCVEFGPSGIRVNMILPGFIINDPPFPYREKIPPALWNKFYKHFETEIATISPPVQPLAFWGESLDIANAAAFLHSPMARYISGAELVVDGGLLCRSPIVPGTANEAWKWTPAMKTWLTRHRLPLPRK